MYDPLTSTYSFACPHGRETQVPLSSFRRLERLPGAVHPAVYRVQFACGCGGEHAGLIAHDDLDWAHLGTTIDRTFRNLMTAHDDPTSSELVELSAGRIRAGEWPWTFFCFLEGRPRPVTPSAFTLIAPGGVVLAADGSASLSLRIPPNLTEIARPCDRSSPSPEDPDRSQGAIRLSLRAVTRPSR